MPIWKRRVRQSLVLLAVALIGVPGALGAVPSSRVFPVPVRGDVLAYGDGRVWVGGLTAHGRAVILPVAISDGHLGKPIKLRALPGGIAVVRGVIWATSGDTFHHRALLWRIDSHTGRTRSFALPGVAAGRLLLRGRAVWVANGDYAGRVFKLDAQSGRLLAIIAVGGLASVLAGSADAIWVSLANRSQLIRIDPIRDRVVARIPVGLGAFNLPVAAGRVWVANDNAGTVSEIDTHTNHAQRSPIHVGTRAASIVATSNQVFVSDPDHNQVIRFPMSTPDQLTRIHAPGLNLVTGARQLWILGDRRLTTIPIHP